MAVSPKIDARKKVAEFLDKKLQAARTGDAGLPPSGSSYLEQFKVEAQGNEGILGTADLSREEVDKYLARRPKEMRTEGRVKYAEDIKASEDPLKFFSETKDQAKDLELSDQQVKKFIAGEMGQRAADRMREQAQTPYQRPFEPKDKRASDTLSPAELAQEGFTGLAGLRAMQERKDAGQGPQGMAKGRALTTPAQRMRRAARLASNKDRPEYNPQEAARLFKEAARIDPERQSFFGGPRQTQAAIEAQKQAIKNIRKFEREK